MPISRPTTAHLLTIYRTPSSLPYVFFPVTQDIDSPAFKNSNGLWWGRTWHMQTPLETLGSGSTMVFELRDGQVKIAIQKEVKRGPAGKHFHEHGTYVLSGLHLTEGPYSPLWYHSFFSGFNNEWITECAHYYAAGLLLCPTPSPLTQPLLPPTPPPTRLNKINHHCHRRRAQGGGGKKVICWGALPLDPDHLNTQPEQLSTYLAPTDPVRLIRARDSEHGSSSQSVGCYGVAAAVGKGASSSSPSSSSSLPLRTDAALAAEVCLTRC